MDLTPKTGFSYLKKVFYFIHLMGLIAAVIFPFAVYPLIGEPAFKPSFVIMAAVFGYGIAMAAFLFARMTLKKQLRLQLEVLESLIGESASGETTLETMTAALESGVVQVQQLFTEIMTIADRLIPYYRSLSQASRDLSERVNEGQTAARVVHKDVETIEERQQEVTSLMNTLSSQSQAESALSRNLSLSLEEMAHAVDHSTAKFLETTTSVEEMAASVREVANQAEDIAQSVEDTAQQMDNIADSFENVRDVSTAGSEAVKKVKQDAEEGLRMMTRTLSEIDLMSREGQQAMAVMERLSHQAQQVGKIIGVIKELVGDTELLAFNAAIIAAKAGDEGKGFAVVADEIKDLADRTTDSAQDIQRIIRAISKDTDEALTAVEATVQRVNQGKENSMRTGDALNQIVHSIDLASATSNEISKLTGMQGAWSRQILNDAGQSLRSVRAVARAMKEQRTGIIRIQDGVSEMKAAVDRVAHGMDEQLQATKDLDRGLSDRKEQILATLEANNFQQQASERLTAHFQKVDARLQQNATKTSTIFAGVDELEKLTDHLRQLGRKYATQNKQETT